MIELLLLGAILIVLIIGVVLFASGLEEMIAKPLHSMQVTLRSIEYKIESIKHDIEMIRWYADKDSPMPDPPTPPPPPIPPFSPWKRSKIE